MARAVLDEPIIATADELSLLRMLAERLGASTSTTFIGIDDEPLLIPDSVYRSLIGVIQALVRGDAVAITPIEATLTVQQAADFLLLPYTTITDLLARGMLTADYADGPPTIPLASLLDYRRRSEYRRQLITEIARDAQAEGLYDDDYPALPDSDQE